MIMTQRRSHISAVAPDGRDNNMIGNVVDACTSATMSAEGAMEVMSHDAPTAWMRLPKFDIRLADQIEAKMREWKGASVEELRQEAGSCERKRDRAVTRAGQPWP